jgi:uncharacterized protein YutE (UPF0331/DUF86 family)
MTDPELVNKKINLITRDLKKLIEYKSLSKDKYLEDFSIRLQVERLLERIINRLIDLNFHIVTTECDESPADYYRSFLMLAQTGVYSPRESKKWAGLAGLRNRLAHEYNQLDQELVYKSYQSLIKKLPDLLEKLQNLFG